MEEVELLEKKQKNNKKKTNKHRRALASNKNWNMKNKEI